MSDNFEELSSFDGSFRPEQKKFGLALDVLPDGDYDFRIQSADLVRTPKSNDLILRVNLEVLSGPLTGKIVEKPYFFDREMSVNMLGSDLMTLGFDADKWDASKGRPFSTEIKRAILKMPGIYFRGKKVINESNGKKYANLYINARMNGAPMPAAQVTPPVKQTAAAPQYDISNPSDVPPWA